MMETVWELIWAYGKGLAAMNEPRLHRRSIRLPGWDYRAAGCYFVTIVTYQRRHLFSDAKLYEIAAYGWTNIPKQPHASRLAIDEWVLMPNHIHGIIHMLSDPEPNAGGPPNPTSCPPGSLGAIIGNYKMLVAKRIKAALRASGTDLRIWHRGYYERIIRDPAGLAAVRRYIQANPSRWADDRDNLRQLLSRMDHITHPRPQS